ncbi:MAG: transketolase C-terminal domain-containing protein, partial [Patescibacteria group bacterium]|nr:transketolase C-terminal domain-containing protein [Patescibacteria group bacterium]
EVLKAYEILKIKNIYIRVVDVFSIKPIDEKILHNIIGDIDNVIVVEDHYTEGGIGEAVRKALVNFCGDFTHLSVQNMPRSGSPDELLAYEKIDFNAIMESVHSVIK